MNLEGCMLREISQAQKGKYHMFSLMLEPKTSRDQTVGYQRLEGGGNGEMLLKCIMS
jgi:hypothetical protein